MQRGLARDLPPGELEGGRIETPAGSYRPPSTPWDLRCEIVVFTIKMMMMMLRIPFLGPSWGHVGLVLGGCRAILAQSRAILGPSWAVFGPCWAVLSRLGPSWGHVGTVLGRLGPSWARLGPSWGHLWPS